MRVSLGMFLTFILLLSLAAWLGGIFWLVITALFFLALALVS